MKPVSTQHWPRPLIVLTVVSICFWLLLTYLSLWQYWGLKNHLSDLGNITQALWNTTQGRFMEMTNLEHTEVDRLNRLGLHANFIYLLFIPIFWLIPRPELLLMLQITLAVSSVVPLYLLGRRWFGSSSWLSIWGPVLWLLNPIIHDGMLYDIHTIVFGQSLIVWAVYAWVTKRQWLVMLSLVLLVSLKEDMPLVAAMFGLYLMLVHKNWRWGSGILVTSLVYFMLLQTTIMPYFRQGASEVMISARYDHVGGSVSGMVSTFVSNPRVFIDTLQSHQAGGYVTWLMVSLGFLPLLSPLALLMLPTLATNLLSSNTIMSQPFGYYYATPIMVIGVVSIMEVLKRLSTTKVFGFTHQQVALGVLLWIIGISWWASPLPYSRVSSWQEFVSPTQDTGYEAMRLVFPAQASLSTQNNLGAPLAMRPEIDRFPFGVDTAEYVVLHPQSTWPEFRHWPRQRNFVHQTQLLPAEYYKAAADVFGSGDFGVVYHNDGYVVLKRDEATSKNAETWEVFSASLQQTYQPLAEEYPIVYKTYNEIVVSSQ